MYKVKGLQIPFKPAKQKQETLSEDILRTPTTKHFLKQRRATQEQSIDLPPYFTGRSRLANDSSFSSWKPHFYRVRWNPATVLILVTFCVFNRLFKRVIREHFLKRSSGWKSGGSLPKTNKCFSPSQSFWLRATKEQWKSCIVRLWAREWDEDGVRRINFHDRSSKEGDKK